MFFILTFFIFCIFLRVPYTPFLFCNVVNVSLFPGCFFNAMSVAMRRCTKDGGKCIPLGFTFLMIACCLMTLRLCRAD